MGIAVNDIVSVVYRSTWAGQRILFTSTWKCVITSSTQGVSQDLDDIGEFFGTLVIGSPLNDYLVTLGDNVTVNSVRAQVVWPIRSIYRETLIGMTGTSGSVATTGNITGTFSLRTDLAGRRMVATKHIGPIGVSTYAGGEPIAGFKAGLTALATEIIQNKTIPLTDTNTLTLDPVIWHKSISQSTPVTNFYVSDRIGTMRRRTLRVGE